MAHDARVDVFHRPVRMSSLVWIALAVVVLVLVVLAVREATRMQRAETASGKYTLPQWAAVTRRERDEQARQENMTVNAMSSSLGATIIKSSKGVGAPTKGDVDLRWVLNHGGAIETYGLKSSDPLWAIDSDINTCWTSAPTGLTYWSLTLDHPRNVQIEIISQTGSGAVETSSDGVTWSKANTRSVNTSGAFVQEVVSTGKIRSVRISAFYGMHLGAPFFLKEVRLHTAQ